MGWLESGRRIMVATSAIRKHKIDSLANGESPGKYDSVRDEMMPPTVEIAMLRQLLFDSVFFGLHGDSEGS